MRRPELPVVSFLCILLLGCSLPSHIRAGSVATISLIAWLAVVSLIRGVNALVWADNVIVRLEVWCDITTKITVGFTYAVPASALCVLRHLESVASTRNARSTKVDKRWRQRFEAVMCFGLPIIGMALHYVVQGHRLDLIEDFGCYPPVYFSVAAIMILWVPPFAMSLITFTYAALALRHFLRHRIEFATHLRNSQSAITPARYFRLMAMAVIEMVWDTGVNAYLIYFNSFTGLLPWTTWDDVHSNFSRVAIFPEYLIPPQFVTQLVWQWWIVPISCILFFIFFGFGEEAMSDYRAAIVWFRQTILRHKMDQPRLYGSSYMLPTHLAHSVTSNNVNLALPTTSDASGDAKPWDELSLKIPEIIEDAPPAFVAQRISLTDHNKTDPFPYDTTSRSISLDESQRSTSLYTSADSSSFTMAEPSDAPSPINNSVSFTTKRPDSGVADSDSSHFPSAAPAATQTTLIAPSTSSDQPSTSSNFEISISPAYVVDGDTSSRYQEALSSSDPSDAVVLHSTHQQGGTAEKASNDTYIALSRRTGR